LIEQLRKHPLYRALRVDKLIYAALGATLESHLRGDRMAEIPVLRMLAITSEEMKRRATTFAAALQANVGEDTGVEIVRGESRIGGGSAPDVKPETILVSLRHSKLSADEIEERLRAAETPIIARIENDLVVIDLRTVAEEDEEVLIETIGEVLP
jgi:L-seryl-tRNA(Ser) seleniumtransferase